jgi:2,3-dihydroxybenzoate-AMP ligase
LRHVLVVGDAAEFIPFDQVAAAPERLPPVDAGDVAFFLLSGGTSGPPKLIPRTHADYAYQLRATADALGFGADGVYLAALPIAHNAALGCPGVLGALLGGGRVVLAQSPGPAEAFPLIEREGVTHTTLISPLVALWVQVAQVLQVRFPNLVLQIGGAKLEPDLGRQVGPVLGCRLSHWFGMAEGPLCHTRLDDADDVVVMTQGRPLSPADDLRVVDETDRDVTPGEIGQLLARGPCTIRGYYNAAAYNQTAFTADGYLRTGDLVRLTASHNLVVEGRIKDVVNRGGEKVSAEEVEQHLLAHPAVREAAIVPMPDPMLGERVCAFVVPNGSGPDLAEMRQFLTVRGLAHYKLPDRLEPRVSLPRTHLGKINKTLLRELITAAGCSDPRADGV